MKEKVDIFCTGKVKLNPSFPNEQFILQDYQCTPYSVRIQENTNHKNSVFRLFSRSISFTTLVKVIENFQLIRRSFTDILLTNRP